ncbi:rhodanese-like domain-containing protein [Actinomadura logoneensis]|uniref:rhodanese-like domain-containing protein n=1 Tax=Actinomadura logoneensis TaxID=2293572 RepID=UPI001F2DEE4F|nr:rhodanese-like domain-containing protein [Actinomadura logoneensis]
MTVSEIQAESPAVRFFATRLAFETDPADVFSQMGEAAEAIIVVDFRAQEAWDMGHVAGAVHLPRAEITERHDQVLDRDALVVVYCWGPGCNGATRSALELARLGYRVKEMIGGFEYWAREGYPVETAAGVTRRSPDPLTAPVAGITCAC